MATYEVEIGQVGAAMRAETLHHQRAIRELATFRAALRGMPVVVKASPVDRGFLRGAWRVDRVKGGANLENDAPHAGIIEAGARPHRPPLMPILRWVVRKWGLDLNGGRRSFESLADVPWPTYLAARTIQENIERRGQEPVGMVANNMARLARILKLESEAVLRQPLPPAVVSLIKTRGAT